MMEYLYFLQNVREACPGFINMVFVGISEFVIKIAPAILVLIMLCIDNEKGYRLGFIFGSGQYVNGLVKLTACVYRPWVKDSRLHVAKEVEESATGYSFPSGHTTAATDFYGGLALWLKKRWVTILAVILTLLTAFARNWLGAHTLWDVLMAMGENVVVLIVCFYVFKCLDKNPKKDIWVLIVAIVLVIIGIIFIEFKSYPLDSAEDGSILVDPFVLMRDFWKDTGMWLGITCGWVMNRRAGKFKVDGSVLTRVIRGVVGLGLFIVLHKFGEAAVLNVMPPNIGSFCGRFMSHFFIYGLYPLIVGIIQKKRDCSDLDMLKTK